MNLRRDQRFSVHFRSYLSAVNFGDYVGTALDLSPRGCKIQSDMSVLTGMHVALRITAPGQSSPIQIERAAVRWSRGHEFGLEFINLRPRDRERLSQIIQRLEQNAEPCCFSPALSQNCGFLEIAPSLISDFQH